MPEARTGFYKIRKHLLFPATFLAASFLPVSCLVLFPSRLSSQVVPAAHGSSLEIRAGVEYSNFLPDFGPPDRLAGIGVYVDLNTASRWSLEGEARFLRFNGFNGESQSSYFIGPKITLFRPGKLRPYTKALFGIGQNNFPFKIGTGRYLALAPGGGVDYRLSSRIMLRGEYEYQLWPEAPGVQDNPSNGMKPHGLCVGFSYKVFGP
jgi:opacity protein-like surface antigen